MERDKSAARIAFATGMIGLGVLGLAYRDFALEWQPVPPGVPWRTMLASAVAVLMLTAGIALCFRRTAAAAAGVLLPYLALWVALKIPAVLLVPRMEAVWLGLGEIVALMAGGWVLFAENVSPPRDAAWRYVAGPSGARGGQLLFGLALLPLGLSHLVYLRETVAFIPAWLPAPTGWAYLTGVGQIAAGLGVLSGMLPRLAAAAEGAMLTIFALLVWLPAVVASPTTRTPWTALLITWAIAGAAWAVAASLPARASYPLVSSGVGQRA